MRKLSYIFLLLLIVACKPSLPSGILDADEMEDVLYDMHVAQTLFEDREQIDNDADIHALRSIVLQKHGIDQAQWDSSYAYYCRNARDMYNIYMSLSERVDKNVIALGGKVDGLQDATADTANVWRDQSYFILMHQAPYNRYSFEILPDSTFEDGDRITMQYDVQMIFQDGYRDVATFLAVHYDNDSIATSITHTTQDGHGIVTINNDVDRLHIKKIRGYMMLNQNLVQRTSEQNSMSLRLASISNVKLLHLRTEPPAPVKTEEPEEQTDSLNRDSLMRDSIMKSHPVVVNKF
ncbi:MAG: DUF4296 domain-containing protein [Prevotella sp.]|nr:DUF4296 domain-containing protein [Candidatus Prevotella equi]